MVRKSKIVTGVLATLLIAGTWATAQAGNDPPATKLERDRTSLVARVQQGIDKANADLDALAKTGDGQKGFAKERIHHMQKTLVFMRDLLTEDRDAITSANADDWTEVRAMVDSDLTGADDEIRLASVAIKTQAPAMGVTNKQPKTK